MNQQEQQEFLLSTFREEVDGHIVTLTRVLVELEESTDSTKFSANIQEMMRVLHTIKGAARMLGFGEITRISHAMEEVVGPHRDSGEVPDRDTIDVLFEGIDTIADLTRMHTRRTTSFNADLSNPLIDPNQINDLISRFQAIAGPETAVVQSPKPDLQTMLDGLNQPEKSTELVSEARDVPSKVPEIKVGGDANSDETIRVSLDKLDGLINAAGELVINKMQNEEHLQAVQLLVTLQRQRSRLASQLREILIEHMPAHERNELLGMTELFSFPEEKPEPIFSAGNLTSQVVNAKEEVNVGLLDRHAITRIYAKLEELIVLDRKIEQLTVRALRERKAYNLRFEALADEVRRNMLDLRMLPLDTIFARFPRPVRDLSNERGKEVRLIMLGGSIELDKRILEEITAPLVQLLRNAVDHGIELPSERADLGKPIEGTIKLTALQKGSQVVIQIEDDGKGIDPTLIRQMAVLKELVSPEQSAALDDQTVLDLIFQPGFSTRTTSDEISGRGYGMDIVQENVKRLNGRVSISSTPGFGTTFSIEIPLTLATMGALLIKSAGQFFAFPTAMINSIQKITKSETKILEGKKFIRLQGKMIPIISLADILNLPALPETTVDKEFDYEEEVALAVLINITAINEGAANASALQQDVQKVAFLVDELIDEREIVVKSLGEFLVSVPNIAGATILGTGDLALILDVYGLIQTVRLGEVYTPPAVSSKSQADYWSLRPVARVLVVDDSLATRELERSILEAAGYQVETARDGAEALQACRERPFNLVLSDVEMPNMDGFRLASAIRNDPRLHGLPVVIVSSRDSEADRRRGMEAGAQAYIVKSHFEQNRLLETIAKLIDF